MLHAERTGEHCLFGAFRAATLPGLAVPREKLVLGRVVYTVVCKMEEERAYRQGWKPKGRGGVLSERTADNVAEKRTGGDQRQASSEGIRNDGGAKRAEVALATASRRGLQGAPDGMRVVQNECVEKGQRVL